MQLKDIEEGLIAVGRRIEAARNARGLSQEQVAEKAGCSAKVVRKAIRGEQVRGKLLAEICQALGISVSNESYAAEVTDPEHGSYSLANFAQYVGRYFAYRRSFLYSRNILRSAFSIRWDKNGRVLRFDEHQKYVSSENNETVDRSQSGEIYHGYRSGLFHLLTKDAGALRLITLSQFRLLNKDDKTMLGIVLTQGVRTFGFQPCAAAIVFEKSSLLEAELKAKVGEVRPNDPDYLRIARTLQDAERHVVNFALTPPPSDPLRPDLG